MLTFEDLVKKISEQSQTPLDEVMKKIEDKQIELSGLVSPEGAAYIVARELGVNLLKETKRKLEIRNIISGMRSVDIIGRIVSISERRDFEKNGRKGSVVNIVVGDETGTVRLSLWNDEIRILENNEIKEGDVVRITGAFAKDDNRGNPELRLGRFGRMEKLEGVEVDIPKEEEIKKDFEVVKEKPISDFREGEMNKMRATVVSIFKKNLFYEVCPECGARLEKRDDKWFCKEHGEVSPSYAMVISGVIDDGTGNIRAVFFRDVAEKLIGKSTEELKTMLLTGDPEKVFDDLGILGKEFIFTGRVKRNGLTDRLEFIVNDIQDVNIDEEVKNLVKKLDGVKD